MRFTISMCMCALGLAAMTSGCRRHRADDVEACTPGVVYAVACDNEGVGRCTGDSVIRVCDGVSTPAECAAGTGVQLAQDDDGGSGLCSRAIVACPASGLFTVTSFGFAGSDRFTCDWRVEPAGGGGLPPELPDDAGP